MSVLTPEAVREDRVLTHEAFSRLLEWLDDGKPSNGETYVEIRRRLVSYFDRRNRLYPDELADETLNRVARTLEKAATIVVRPPARYCYVVAKFVLHEDIRRARKTVQVEEERMAADPADAPDSDSEPPLQERRLACLDRCLERLRPEQRELAIEYYRDSKRRKIERRRDLASRLGITMNALGIRACRIRSSLEQCVEGCCARDGFQGVGSYRQ